MILKFVNSCEIENHLNFNLIKINKFKELNFNSLGNYLIITIKKKRFKRRKFINKMQIKT